MYLYYFSNLESRHFENIFQLCADLRYRQSSIIQTHF